MNNKKKLLLWFTVLILTVLACSLTEPSTTEDGRVILFEDDFSSSSSGWDEYADESGSAGYYQDNYLISVLEPSFSYWGNPYESFEDIVIEVEVTKISGGSDDEFGVMCRNPNAENFYVLAISSDGFAAINKRVNGSELIPLTDGFQPFDVINQGEAITNSIRAECVGTRLTLFANDVKLLEATDSDLASGDIGLYAGTFEADSTEVVFDNLLVTQP